MWFAEVNGQPGAVFLGHDGRAVWVVSLDIADGLVQAIRAVTNPDKLRHLGPSARGPGRLLAERGPVCIVSGLPEPSPSCGWGGAGMSHGKVLPCLEIRTPGTKEDAMKIFVAGATGALGRRLVPLRTEIR